MRKAMIVTLLLLVLSVGGVCVAAAGVYEAHDQVVLTENTVYGDRAAADGLTVRLRAMYNYHLFWDTIYAMDTRTETEYSFSAAEEYGEDAIIEYSGVSFDATQNLGSFDMQEPQTGLGLAYQELYQSIGPGEEGETVVYLKDYIDYYPFHVILDFPDARDRLDAYEEIDDPLWEANAGTELYAMLKIRDYFKIPILEEEQYSIHLRRDENGLVDSMGGGPSGTSDNYYIQTISVLSDDACYFTFDAHSGEGQVVDTSELPDGYGIYRLPYEEDRHDESGQKVCGVDADALEMVYPLDPEIEPVFLCVNPEQTKLLLHAMEHGEYTLTVIDIETMTALQTLKLAGRPEKFYDQGGYMVIALSDMRLAVVAVTDSGDYELQYVCDLWPDGFEAVQTGWWSAVAFDGERLAVFGELYDEEYGAYEPCNFFLAVYEPSGLAYYGEYRNSLSTKADLSDFGRYASQCVVYAQTVSWDGEPDKP